MELGRINLGDFRSKTRPFEQQNELGTLSLRNGAYRKGSVVASLSEGWHVHLFCVPLPSDRNG